MFKKVFFLAVSASSLLAFGAQATDFSADMISTSKQGVMKAKIFMADKKVRMETDQAVTITRMDKNVSWTLMPAQKMYMETVVDAQSMSSMPNAVSSEKTLLGKETLDGKTVDKYKVVVEASGQKTTVIQWIDPALQFPVKASAEDSSWTIEYKNIKTVPIDSGLFELPAGYQKLNMPSFGSSAPASAQPNKPVDNTSKPSAGQKAANTTKSAATDVVQETGKETEDAAKDKAKDNIKSRVFKGFGL